MGLTLLFHPTRATAAPGCQGDLTAAGSNQDGISMTKVDSHHHQPIRLLETDLILGRNVCLLNQKVRHYGTGNNRYLLEVNEPENPG